LSPVLLVLIASIVRVWAIVRIQPWLRASVGIYADVFAVALAVALAGMTSSPAALSEIATTSWETASHCDAALATSPEVAASHGPCRESTIVAPAQARAVLVGALVEGTFLGIVFGLVSSAWIAVVRSPLFGVDLFAGHSSPAFVSMFAALAALLVIDAGAHHEALRLLFDVAQGSGVIEDVSSSLVAAGPLPRVDGDGSTSLDAGLVGLTVGLVSLTMTTTVAFVVSAGFPLLVVDATRQAVANGAPMLALASDVLGAVLRPALLLLWLATTFTVMPSAWIDAFLAGPWLR
jgi:hypothetical protein